MNPSFNLAQLMTDIGRLPPSERKRKLVAFAMSHFKGDQVGLREELDEMLDVFQVIPRDYALLLHTSKSFSWALDALKASHPAIVTTAVDIVGKKWRQDPLVVKDAFGGEGSKYLVQLVDTTLPRYATMRLFRIFGTVPRVSPAHSHMVDDILQAIFPFLSNDRPTPLTRYARSAVVVLFAAASPSVVMTIVQRCAAWFNEGTWKRLTESRPELAKEIFLRQIDPAQTGTFPDDVVVKKQWNKMILWALLRSEKDSVFFSQFLDYYVAKTLQDKEAPDVFGLSRSSRSATLFNYMAFILQKRTDPGEIFSTGIILCEVVAKLVDAGVCDEWTWECARPLLEIACHEFGKYPEEWSLAKIEISAMQSYPQTATGLLLAIFSRQQYTDKTYLSPSPALIHLLRRLPLPARFPFLNLLYITKTSESLVETPNNPLTYPTFSAFVLSLLYPSHGRALLEVGRKAREELFISSQIYYSLTKLYDFSGLSVADATSTILLANWAGFEQSALGECTTGLGQAGDATVRDVESYKKRAMRSRDDRPNLVTTALTLCLLSRSPSLFVDTLSWAVKRYAKDPETSPTILAWLTKGDQYVVDFLSGPVGLYASHRTRGKLTKEMLLVWCTKTNETFSSLMELLDVWVGEPSYRSSIQYHYETVGSLLFQVVKGRSALMEKVYPVLLDDLVGLGDVLFSPLVECWMNWEKFKVQTHPDVLGFNATHCVPCQSHHSLTVHSRILPVVFSFMAKVGLEREQLYRSGRLGLSNEDINIESRRQQLLGGVRHILPFHLAVTGTQHTSISCHGIHLPDEIYGYVKGVVLPGDLSASVDAQDDPLDWHPVQFSAALESFLVYSKDKREIDSKIQHLLLRYGASDSHGDFRSIILRSDIVQSYLWDREVLNGQVCSWLPEFPPSNSSEDINFDPLHLMPPKVQFDDSGTKLMVALRDLEEDNELALNTFLWPFMQFGLSSRGASINTIHRLVVLVVAWILTILDVPRKANAAMGNGPVHYAIQKVRLSRKFCSLYGNSIAGGDVEERRSVLPCHMLHLILPFVSLQEVDDFARAVFSVEKTPISEAVSMAILGAIRRLGIPDLASDQLFHVLEDVEASSWHRQTFTIGTVNRCRPLLAQQLTDRLLQYTQGRHREQIERRKMAPTPAPSRSVPSEASGPLLKMSTHKMVLQLLKTVVEQGSVDAAFVERSADAGLLEVSPAIRSYVVDVLVGIVQDSFVIAREGDELIGKWETLSTFIAAAQRLNEDVPFSNDQWAAARAGEIPMPDIVEERYIAASLLSRNPFSMPSSLKRAWAEKVVAPIVVGHVEMRTRWLKTAVAREGGSPELESSISATYSNRMPVLSSFGAFAPHLPGTQKPILRILEHDALAFLTRYPCQELRDLVAKNHPSGWERKPYGGYIKKLTAYAISDATDTGSSAMTAISNILTNPNMPPSLVEDVASSLRYIGSILLQPDNMSVHANQKAVVPFASFTRFVTTHLASPGKDSLDPKTVALLGYFLTLSEEFERQKSRESLNGGACYWRIILILKLLSLRIATNVPTGNTDNTDAWVETRARQLGQLAKDVSERGWYHVHFPQSFESYLRLPRVEDVIPVCLALTQSPNCPTEQGWLRALCFDTAVMLLRAKQKAIVDSPAALRQLANLRQVWKHDADGSICWLSLSWHDKAV